MMTKALAFSWVTSYDDAITDLEYHWRTVSPLCLSHRSVWGQFPTTSSLLLWRSRAGSDALGGSSAPPRVWQVGQFWVRDIYSPSAEHVIFHPQSHQRQATFSNTPWTWLLLKEKSASDVFLVSAATTFCLAVASASRLKLCGVTSLPCYKYHFLTACNIWN